MVPRAPGRCGKEHGALPMDLAYRRPLDYFKVPEAQRAERVWINDDLCVIDDEMFLIRGVVPVPVHDGDAEDEFRWGVWLEAGRYVYDEDEYHGLVKCQVAIVGPVARGARFDESLVKEMLRA